MGVAVAVPVSVGVGGGPSFVDVAVGDGVANVELY